MESNKTEVLSFDIDEYNSRECQVHNHGFYLGEQSKQGEVDKLQKRVKELELINFDSELHFDAAKEHIDHLQKRIDLALDKIYFWVSCENGDAVYVANSIESILKGEETK